LDLNSNNLQQAIDWLFAHVDDPDPVLETASVAAAVHSSAANDKNPTLIIPVTLPEENNLPKSPKKEMPDDEANLTANSLKCDDCGILLKDEDFATLHAHKTGHVNFSQSTESLKPKTKEEIEEQKKRLAEKLTRIRQEKAEKEKAEQIEAEKARRKQGRQLNEIKQKFQEDELKRIAEEKRRDKLADIAYKQKVKEQIAKDREAKKREASGAPVVEQQQPIQPQPIVQEKKDYSQCKLQIRLTDGKSIIQTFEAKEPLAAVRVWIEINRTDGSGPFNIMQTFPRKVYQDEDMVRSLNDLGLVPASTLVITKV
jgi:UBX domain-containing protein 1/4